MVSLCRNSVLTSVKRGQHSTYYPHSEVALNVRPINVSGKGFSNWCLLLFYSAHTCLRQRVYHVLSMPHFCPLELQRCPSFSPFSFHYVQLFKWQELRDPKLVDSPRIRRRNSRGSTVTSMWDFFYRVSWEWTSIMVLDE